ncbi:hypothetical protein ACFLZR_01590, partial [Candidatus Neomarinimicrobiota bacterium]
TRDDSLLKFRMYAYWEDDQSIKRMTELRPDSVLLRELLFGDEPRSREFIRYLVGGTVVADFRDRFTEVIFDTLQRPVIFRITSTQGAVIGVIFLNYDHFGYLINETWYEGEARQLIREFSYVFHRATGEVEVIERGRDGQVASHVRIQDPHRVTGDRLGLTEDYYLEVPEGSILPSDSLDMR